MTIGGNAGKRGAMPATGNFEVKTTDILPDPPKSLGEEGCRRWKELGTIIVGRKIWSNDWVPALEHLCRSYDNLFAIDEALNQPGESYTVVSMNARSVKTHPLLDYRLKVECYLNSQLNYFGLTPMSSKGIFTKADNEGSTTQKTRVRARTDGPMFKVVQPS